MKFVMNIKDQIPKYSIFECNILLRLNKIIIQKLNL
jgi:hypothetical protein